MDKKGDFRQYQRDFRQLESRYNNYTVQTDRELSMMEDYIDSVRDGLVCYGGFYKVYCSDQRTEKQHGSAGESEQNSFSSTSNSARGYRREWKRRRSSNKLKTRANCTNCAN